MDLLQAAILALEALILVPGVEFYFDVIPKVVVLLTGTAALLLWHARRPAAPLPDPSGVRRIFVIIVVCNAVSVVVSATLSRNPALSWLGTNWRRFGSVEECAILLFAWLVARHNAANPARVRTILRGAALAGIAASAYGVAQYFGWDPILPKAAYHVGEGIWTIVRPPGTLGYASYFATWLVVTAFLSLALAAVEKSRWWRAMAWNSAGLSLAALFLNGTRAALVGLVAGGAVWMWGRGFGRGRRAAAVIGLAALAAAAFYVSPAGLQLRSRTRWFIEDPWGGGRGALWKDTLSMASHRLVAGYGPEVFTAAFPAYESARLARQLPDFSYESPHNMLLDALVAQGIPGLLAMCALCWVGFRAGRRSGHPAGLAIAAAVAAGVISQQFTVFTVPTALIIYVAAALGVALGSSASEAAPMAGGRLSRVAPRMAAGIAAAVFLVVATRLLVADVALASARRNLDARRISQAAADYARYDWWRLPGTSADLWYSRASITAAQSPGLESRARLLALAQYGFAAVRATETGESPFDAWYNAAQYYAVRNDAARTEQALRAAIAARPNWFKPHWTLAQVLRLENRLPEADREASLAVDLDGGAHAEVRVTRDQIHAALNLTEPLHK